MEPTTPIAEAIAAYVARVAERGRGTAAFPRTRSHQTYGYALHRFELFLSETRPTATTIANLEASDLAEYTRWLARRYQGTTVQLYTTALKGFLQLLTLGARCHLTSTKRWPCTKTSGRASATPRPRSSMAHRPSWSAMPQNALRLLRRQPTVQRDSASWAGCATRRCSRCCSRPAPVFRRCSRSRATM